MNQGPVLAAVDVVKTGHTGVCTTTDRELILSSSHAKLSREIYHSNIKGKGREGKRTILALRNSTSVGEEWLIVDTVGGGHGVQH